MMRIAALLAAVVLASGCAGTPAAEVVTVQVKVKEACIEKPPQRPAYKTGRGAYPGDAAAASVLASDFERAEQYGVAWEAAAAGCLMIKPSASESAR